MLLGRSWPIRGGAADIYIYMPLTGPLFPIGIENPIYMFFCYGSSNGY